MPHTSVITPETPLVVKIHSGRKGFTLLNGKTRLSIGTIAFDSLHKIHRGMQEVRADRNKIFEGEGAYDTVTVVAEKDLYRVTCKPYDSKASPIDALLSIQTVENMVGLANTFHCQSNRETMIDLVFDTKPPFELAAAVA